MKGNWVIPMTAIGLMVVGGALSSAPTSKPKAALCSVVVSKPVSGESVGADVLVTGSASVPPNAFLHIFARRRGLSQLAWPQGGGAAVVERGQFSVLTMLGEPRDKGQEFEILVQIVDTDENAKIQAWYKRAEESGKYPGMQLPPFLSGCGAPTKVTVVKTE